MQAEACPKDGIIADRNSLIEAEIIRLAGSPIEGKMHLTESVELSQYIADSLNLCEKCGGMVVDLATGKLYCGLEPPTEVLESNQRILAS